MPTLLELRSGNFEKRFSPWVHLKYKYFMSGSNVIKCKVEVWQICELGVVLAWVGFGINGDTPSCFKPLVFFNLKHVGLKMPIYFWHTLSIYWHLAASSTAVYKESNICVKLWILWWKTSFNNKTRRVAPLVTDPPRGNSSPSRIQLFAKHPLCRAVTSEPNMLFKKSVLI